MLLLEASAQRGLAWPSALENERIPNKAAHAPTPTTSTVRARRSAAGHMIDIDQGRRQGGGQGPGPLSSPNLHYKFKF